MPSHRRFGKDFGSAFCRKDVLMRLFVKDLQFELPEQ
jgi:hypothetical protein